ncbi:MAG TPA: DUF5590 domain-containing protein [Pseudogracilibacillus sp.]|nr:DUF5590 domain-containing protein [Pseudogracilibacillus sp.]
MNQNEVNVRSLVKKIITILIIFAILFLLLYIVYFFTIIDQSKYNEIGKSQALVKEEAYLESIFERYEFVEEETYHIFYGKNNDDEYTYVFVPLKERGDHEQWTVTRAEDINKVKAVEEKILNECDSCQLKYSKPAIIDDTPLWEIAYYENDVYTLDYIEMESNERFERLRMK